MQIYVTKRFLLIFKWMFFYCCYIFLNYHYRETWEKKNIVFHENNTVSFQQEKIYRFDRSQSVGSEDDVVVVPNIPMLVRPTTIQIH